MYFVSVGFSLVPIYVPLHVPQVNTYLLQVVQQIALLTLDVHRFFDWKVGC